MLEKTLCILTVHAAIYTHLLLISGMLMEAVKHLSLFSLTDEAALIMESRWDPFEDLPFDLFRIAGVTLLRLKMRVMNLAVLPFFGSIWSFPSLRFMSSKLSKLLEVFSHAFPSYSSSEALEVR